MLWKDMALFETQRETVCPAHSQLTFHIKKGNIDGGAMVDDVVDNDSRVGIVAHGDAHGGCYGLPLAIKVIDHANECSWSVGWPKGHVCVSPFNGVRSLECKFLLAGAFDGELMVA